MKALVLGASGATGKLVVTHLIKRNIQAQIVLRETAILPIEISESKQINIIRGNIDEFGIDQIKEQIDDCDWIICCLGHNITLKGIFCRPRKLVFDAIRKITEAIYSLNLSKKIILMSTTAFTNGKQNEKNTFGECIVFSLLKIFLPPHKDNMLAVEYLINSVGSDHKIEWVAVRPDSLFDEDRESEYEICQSRVRSPIFDPGKTSRINVSHFIVQLMSNDTLWQEWKYKTPVIYNKV